MVWGMASVIRRSSRSSSRSFASVCFQVVDVGIGSIPFDNLAGLVLQGFYSDEEPAVSSIVAAKARFDFASFSRSD